MNQTVPRIAELRERFAAGLSKELIDQFPRLSAARIHAHGEERVPLFMLASVCRFLAIPVAEHGADPARLALANERLMPATLALLDALEVRADTKDMYESLDRLVSAAAAANRALVLGEGSTHP